MLGTISRRIAKNRNYIEEILSKKQRLLSRTNRMKQYENRVLPVVSGLRKIKKLNNTVDFRNEWLKYGAIGYIACVEGYFRLLVADLIDDGESYLSNLTNYKEIKLGMEHIVAIQTKKISLGDYVAHLMPFNSVVDINRNLSIILDVDYFDLFKSHPCSPWNKSPIGEVFPELIGNS